ncbi:microtubule-associated protein 9-like [Littorina saxatilis]|uniref:Uncharacterized protein n=1 Tax=Littorina saxatilis TaxID=31220 RepID=A0AAN9BRJ1_9CAEN
MDEVDSPVRSRRPRVKNSFQMEIESKMKERRAKGLVADITSEESEEDSIGDMQFGSTMRHQNRPASATRRGDHATSNRQLGDTMRTQDLEKLLGRKTPTSFDDEDDEIASTLKGKPSAGFGLSQRKTPPAKEGLFGRKTPTSPLAQEMSKEDIIFGRKTPTQSQLRGKSPQGGSDLPNLGGQQPWQPPSFRNVSPSADRHSPGSQGRRTPGLEGLDSISEKKERTPRLGYDKRGSPGLSEESPRSDKPTPRARGKQAEKEPARPARTTPTLDLFGKSRRESSMEIEKELKTIEDKEKAEDRFQRRLTGKKTPTDSKSPHLDRKSPGLGSKSPGLDRKSPGLDRKSPGLDRKSPGLDRKSPGFDRRTPTEKRDLGGRKSPGLGRNKSPGAADRKVLGDYDSRARRTPTGRKSPGEGRLRGDDKHEKPEEGTSSLLAFLTGEADEKPKPKERQPKRSKIPKDEHKEIFDIGEVPYQPAPRQTRKFADDSSICEDLKEDPTVYSRGVTDAGDGKKRGIQRTERQLADDIIDKLGEEQKRIDFKPVKKVRPVSAQAKVQHRPKPRYGTLPGQTSKEATMPEFNSTIDIREAVYEDWYRKRMKSAREEQKEKQRKEEEAALKKKQAEEEKRSEAMLSYKAWEESKKEVLSKEKARQKREEEKKREKERQDREDKRTEAEITFKSWKEKKDVVIKSKVKDVKIKEREKKETEEEEKRRKEKESTSAFRGWKTKKDSEIKHKVKDVKKVTQVEETTKMAIQRQKEEEAQHRYDEWMHNKEKQDHRKKIEQRRKNMTGSEMDFRPAWSPANHTVPFGR